MIGMSQIKKRLFIGIAIGGGIGLVGIIAILWWASSTIKTYEKGTNTKYLATSTVEIVTFNRDVIQGETITADILTKVRIHISTKPQGAVTNPSAIVGQVIKYNVSKSMPITSNMLSNKIISTDVRIHEVSQILIPTDAREKDFIDIRLKMPSGIDYIVLTQKQIQKITGNTMWFNLSEEELHIINSATVDAYTNPGIIFYAVQYTDPQTQIKLDEKATAEKAKDFLTTKILEEANSGKIPMVEPDKTPVPVINTTTTTTTVENENEIIPTKENPELTTFRETITALLLKYAIEYRYFVESYNKTSPNYQPNNVVIAHMKENKFIVDEAKAKLSEEARLAMSIRNEMFETMNKDNITSIVSGAQDAINSQKNMRTSVLTPKT